MTYTAQVISSLIAPGAPLAQPGSTILHLLTDSRRLQYPDTTLFFALPGGHSLSFVKTLYAAGVRNFVVTQVPFEMKDANFFPVPDVLAALQQLAAFHRAQFTMPVIGITGSNGKTIVKEWLFQVLHEDQAVIRSPRSYNSQVGVPLSLWQMAAHHRLAIIEAGISLPGEMARLQRMIRPTIGVLTNIGEAHSEGFASLDHKRREKTVLFSGCAIVIGNEEAFGAWQGSGDVFSWGRSEGATLKLLQTAPAEKGTDLFTEYRGERFTFTIPFRDEASVANAMTVICVLLHLAMPVATIRERILRLHTVDMRLQVLHGINRTLLLNDSYSADITSLHTALHFLAQQSGARQRVAILSDFAESGKKEEALYAEIARGLEQNGVAAVVAIGEAIGTHLPRYLPEGIRIYPYRDTNEFLHGFRPSLFGDSAILIKGARKAGFERIARLLEVKVHQTVLEVNLTALAHNLKVYRQFIPAGTKVMAMVKAFSYGSGGFEIAGMLQFSNVDYLGVAYADEGVDLRKAGITLPVVVLNTDEASFPVLVEFNLQPVLYSLERLRQFQDYLEREGLEHFPVHLEVETGMNRLGFGEGDLSQLEAILGTSAQLKVESVFSHLAASDLPQFDDFTAAQAAAFDKAAKRLTTLLPYPFLKHIANSAAILRHPALSLDMVRLGIGLYGIETVPAHLPLRPVAALRSTIAQLKELKTGESVSYNRSGIVKRDSMIATVRIGYADGYPRRLGNGVGKMWVRGQLAPVIGNICMDMTMLDVTGIGPVSEGDDVVIFGEELLLQQVADWAQTIPYEIMTGISQRVKRVYFQE